MSVLKISCLVAAVTAVSAGAQPPRVLCDRCRGMMFIASVGKCVECAKPSASGAHKLCRACSGRLAECVHCRIKLVSSGQKGVPPPVAPITVGESAHGKTVSVLVGQQLTVQLAGNPTTGYRWDVVHVAGEAVVRHGKPAYRADPVGRPPVAGKGGRFECCFLAKRPGKATVELHYRRPWEKAKKPAKRVLFTVEVMAVEEPK